MMDEVGQVLLAVLGGLHAEIPAALQDVHELPFNEGHTGSTCVQPCRALRACLPKQTCEGMPAKTTLCTTSRTPLERWFQRCYRGATEVHQISASGHSF